METTATTVQSHLDRLVNWATGQDAILVLYLYGSQAAGHANALSDIDVGVLVKPELPKDALWRKELAWAGQWGEPIDLCVINLAPLAFQYEVTAQGRRLWAADVDEVAALESLIWRRYWDVQPLLQEHWNAYVQHLMEGRSATERQQYQASLEQVRAVHRRVSAAAGDDDVWCDTAG